MPLVLDLLRSLLQLPLRVDQDCFRLGVRHRSCILQRFLQRLWWPIHVRRHQLRVEHIAIGQQVDQHLDELTLGHLALHRHVLAHSIIEPLSEIRARHELLAFELSDQCVDGGALHDLTLEEVLEVCHGARGVRPVDLLRSVRHCELLHLHLLFVCLLGAIAPRCICHQVVLDGRQQELGRLATCTLVELPLQVNHGRDVGAFLSRTHTVSARVQKPVIGSHDIAHLQEVCSRIRSSR